MLAAKSSFDIESSLNTISVPPRDESGQHSAEFLKIRPSLKSALEAVLERKDLINNRLSRRITRLIYALLTDDEREVEKMKAVARPKQVPPAPKANKFSGPSSLVNTPRTFSLTECAKALTNAVTSQDVEEAVKDLNIAEIAGVEAKEVEDLSVAVDSVLSNEAILGNAKMKRRLIRLKDAALKLPITHSRVDTDASGSTPTPAFSTPGDMKDIKSALQELRAAGI